MFRKGRMRDEASAQELKIREVDRRIESEIANLRTSIEASKVRCPGKSTSTVITKVNSIDSRQLHCNISLVSVS